MPSLLELVALVCVLQLASLSLGSRQREFRMVSGVPPLFCIPIFWLQAPSQS